MAASWNLRLEIFGADLTRRDQATAMTQIAFTARRFDGDQSHGKPRFPFGRALWMAGLNGSDLHLDQESDPREKKKL